MDFQKGICVTKQLSYKGQKYFKNLDRKQRLERNSAFFFEES